MTAITYLFLTGATFFIECKKYYISLLKIISAASLVVI
jgi:hypothetical protein